MLILVIKFLLRDYAICLYSVLFPVLYTALYEAEKSVTWKSCMSTKLYTLDKQGSLK